MNKTSKNKTLLLSFTQSIQQKILPNEPKDKIPHIVYLYCLIRLAKMHNRNTFDKLIEWVLQKKKSVLMNLHLKEKPF